MSLTIYIPFTEGTIANEPKDEDAWFIESLFGFIDAHLKESLDSKCNGYWRSTDKIGIAIFEPAPDILINALQDILRRYCPDDAYLYKSNAGSIPDETIPLFNGDRLIPREKLPVSDPRFEYRPYEIEPLAKPCKANKTAHIILKAITLSDGIDIKSIIETVNRDRRFDFSEKKCEKLLGRLEEAGFIYSEYVKGKDFHYYATDLILQRAPITASGKVSSLRKEAWQQLYDVCFKTSTW